MYEAFPTIFPKLSEAWINVVNLDLVGTKGSGTETYRLRSEKCGPKEVAKYCIAGDAHGIHLPAYNSSTKTSVMTGTSFMAPQVSGALALVAQAFPTQTPKQWTARLLASANNDIKKAPWINNYPFVEHKTGNNYSFDIIGEVDFGNGVKHGYSEGAGHGILDVYAALQPITSNDFTNSLYSGRSSNLAENRFEWNNSFIRSSPLMENSLTSNLRNVNNKFFDAMGGGFDYSVSKDILKSSVSTSSLNFESNFNSLEKLSKTKINNNNKIINFSGSIIDHSDLDKKQRLITTLDKPLPTTQKLMKDFSSDLSAYSTFGSSFLSSNSGGVGVSYIKENKNNRYYFGISEPVQAFDGVHDRKYGSSQDIAFGIDFLHNQDTEISSVFGISSEEEKLGMVVLLYNLEGSKSLQIT